MKLCRFTSEGPEVRVGLIADENVIDLTGAGVTRMQPLLEMDPVMDVAAAVEPTAASTAFLRRCPAGHAHRESGSVGCGCDVRSQQAGADDGVAVWLYSV